MLQKTRTMPGNLNVTALDVFGGYNATSKGCPLKLEKALWKMGSRFGMSTVLPTEIASTCGTNCLSRWSITTRFGGIGGTGWSVGSGHVTTPWQALCLPPAGDSALFGLRS